MSTTQKWQRWLVPLLCAMALVVGGASPAHAAVSATSTIEVHHTLSLAKVDWAAATGAVKYNVEVSKVGFYGPWRLWPTTSTVLNVALTDHPYRSSQGFYKYRVYSYDAAGHSASKATVYEKSGGSGVSSSNSSSAANKVNTCIKQGLAAGLATGAAGGIVVIAAAWIPGIGEVTAASVAAAAASIAAGTFAVCLIPW